MKILLEDDEKFGFIIVDGRESSMVHFKAIIRRCSKEFKFSYQRSMVEVVNQL